MEGNFKGTPTLRKGKKKHLMKQKHTAVRGAEAVSFLGSGFRKIPVEAYISDPVKNRNKNGPPKMRLEWKLGRKKMAANSCPGVSKLCMEVWLLNLSA